jgi:hypothetical protein
MAGGFGCYCSQVNVQIGGRFTSMTRFNPGAVVVAWMPWLSNEGPAKKKEKIRLFIHHIGHPY